MGCFDCFGGGLGKQERLEQERIASEEVRAKAAEAAQKRQEQFEQSAQGRAARAQIAAMSKQSAAPNKGEPVLKIPVVGSNPNLCIVIMEAGGQGLLRKQQ